MNNDNTDIDENTDDDTDDDTEVYNVEEYSGDYDDEDIVPLANSDAEEIFGYENPLSLENSDQSSVSANSEESISELETVETDNSDSSQEINDPDDGPRMFLLF